MTDREKIHSGLTRIAWGYVLLYFDLNLESLSVTPAVVGYLLFLPALGLLSAERRSLALLRPLGVFLALWSGANWLLSWIGGTVNGHIPFLDVLVGAAAIYFHFQLLTDLAAIAAAHQEEGQGLDRRILKWRTVNVLLQTILPLTEYLSHWLSEDAVIMVMVVVTLVCIFVMVCLTASVFSLRKLFRPSAEPAG